ncbi:sigma-70 family RNA polymerase sigma factor [Microlunatus panaciterrae]|nr:sigma-70 family RNA polymerase sigma factor [Microlunatus panaciterrae]
MTMMAKNHSARTHHDDAASRRERTNQLFAAALEADEAERQALHEQVVLLHLDVADSLAHRYQHRGQDIADLAQVAKLALVEAVGRYDPERGDFLAFATPTILGSLKRHFRDHGWMVRPPRRIQDLQAEINEAWSTLTQQQQATPSNDDLADYLGVDHTNVVEAQGAHGCFHAASLEAPYGDAEAGLAGVLGDADPGFELVERLACLEPACQQLSESDQRLLYLRFFEERTQAEIAKEFGVSQMQISRSLKRILAALRSAAEETERTVRPVAADRHVAA